MEAEDFIEGYLLLCHHKNKQNKLLPYIQTSLMQNEINMSWNMRLKQSYIKSV